MKNSIFIVSFFCTFFSVLIFFSSVVQDRPGRDFSLANVVSLAEEEEIEGDEIQAGTGKICTQYDYPDHLLSLRTCFIIFWAQKLKCRPTDIPDRCCKSNEQKSCSSDISWPSLTVDII